jgi:hypothetical protein
MTYNFDNLYNLPEPNAVKNEGQARDIAQQWQRWQSEKAMSYGEVTAWADWFTELAKRFGLEDEFKENGII